MFIKYSSHILLILSILLLSSCSSLKKISQKRQTENQLQQRLEEQANIQSIDSKLTLNIASSTRVSGQIKLQYDSCLWLSVQPFLGIEALRLMSTPDRIQAINRLNKMYIDESLRSEDLSILPSWTFQAMSNLLLNRIFVPGKSQPSLSDFEIVSGQNGEIIMSHQEDSLSIDFMLNAQKQLYRVCIHAPNTQNQIVIDYSVFQTFNDLILPCRIYLSGMIQEHIYGVQLDYVKPQLNTRPSYTFSISTQYKKSSIEQMLKNMQ